MTELKKNAETNTQSLTTFVRENTFQLLAVVITVLNLWLTSKLAPLSESVRVLDSRVEALESTETPTTRELQSINSRLDRIESRLDSVILGGN